MGRYAVYNAHVSSPRLIGCEQALTLHYTHVAIVTAAANSRKDPTATLNFLASASNQLQGQHHE